MTYEQTQEAYRDAQTMERWSILSDSDSFISDYPSDYIPAGAVEFCMSDGDSGCTVKGFYDPSTDQTHIQAYETNN